MVELGFINDEVRVKFQENDSGNLHAHTHMNVTPHIRQHVISELQEDEDLKEWWERCKEIVALDMYSEKSTNRNSKIHKYLYEIFQRHS